MAASRFIILLVCFLGLSGYVTAAANLAYNGIPPCAVSCVLEEIGAGHSTCALTNQTCICNDNILAEYVQACVMAKCTVKEMLVAKNQSLAACGVSISQHESMMHWFRILLFGLPTFFIIARITNRLMKLSPWGWDDATFLVSYSVLAAFLPAAYLAEATGAGRDVWTLTPSQITFYLLLLYIFGLLYMTSLAFLKASLLFLYLRIFPDEKFRRVLWCTQVFNLCLLITFVGGSSVSCQPIHYFWNGWTGEMKGKCIDLNAFVICHAALNLILDVWMLLLPATQVCSLNMPRMRKLGVMLMFCVGVFLTAASAYRIKALLVFGKSFNITADSFPSSLCSHIELCVGVSVACLPSTRHVWRRIFPKIRTQLSRSGRSHKASQHDESQASRAISTPLNRVDAVANEELSIAHSAEEEKEEQEDDDSRRDVDVNKVLPPSEPDTPSSSSAPTETKNQILSKSFVVELNEEKKKP